jgi:branched-chain amino acid transport system substrate-binding protein
MKQGWWRAAAAVVGVLVVLAAAAGVAAEVGQARGSAEASSASHTVRVGVVYSRTGLLAAYGAQYIQGLRLGLEYATKGTNRVNGHRIVLTPVDDATDPARAVSAARDLIGQGYKILAGSISSGIAPQVAAQAAQNRVLFISGPAAADAMTGINRYTFRSGRQTFQDVLAVREVLRGQANRRILVFAQDSAFGQGNVAAVRQVAGSGHTVSSVLVPLSANDFTPFAQQARNANADLIFVAWAGTTYAPAFRALEQQGVLRATTVVTGLAERATWSTYPTGVNFLSHYVYNAPKNRVNDWLMRKMRRRGQLPDLFHPDGFNAALMIVRAVQRSGGDDVERMISALEGWQFVGPKGINRIRAQDHALLQPMFQVRLVRQGNRLVPRILKRFSPGNLQPPVRAFPN